MNIKLSDHFTYGRLLRFTLPSVAMMIFTSVYSVVDGFFVSNFAGKIPFAAVNFVMPLLMVLGAVGFMFGTGGSAWVAKTMGEGDRERANRNFSLFVYATAILGAAISLLGLIFLRPIMVALGAEGQLLEDCLLYGGIILAFNPAFLLQVMFQSFFITAEKPQLGLISTVVAGVTNMVLDALLVGVFPLGLVGAAAATSIAQVVGAVFPIVYFARPNTSLLHLGKTDFDGKALLKTCTNGSSELMSNLSMSLVGMLYNVQLLRYAGENGIASYGVMMYVNFVFIAMFIGYSIGSAPVISFHYGAGNRDELRSLRKKSVNLIAVTSVVMVVIAQLLAGALAKIFVGYDADLCKMTVEGFRIFSFSFLFAGFAIFASGFFTALNDGLTSAIVSFLRTLVFQVGAILILPLVWELNGIWLSVVMAELMAVAVSVLFLVEKRKKFGY